MLNRLLLAALLVALPLTAAGLDMAGPQMATANITTGWDPSADAGVDAIPDRDDSSARFLILSGPNNSTLTGDAGGAGQTFVKVTFTAEAPTDPIRIAIFDPNSIGMWDQRVDGRLLTVAPNVRYTLYSDPAGDALERLTDVDNTNDPSIVVETDAVNDYNGNAATDSAWCDFYNSTVADNAASKTTGSCQCRFLMRAQLEPGAGQIFLQGPERAGHKFAFNGSYLLPAETVIGFAGGAVDERTIIGTENQLIHNTQDPVSYLGTTDPAFIADGSPAGAWFFNGIVDFRFLGVQACPGDIVMEEADADFQDPTSMGQTQFDPLLNPTGIPPDNIPFYRLPGNDPFPFRDVSDFIILSHDPDGTAIPVRWRVFPLTTQHTNPPDGDQTPANAEFSSENDTAAGHASYDVNVQSPLPPVNDPFQPATLARATLMASPGPWCVRWESVDKANFIFMKFNRDVGTTPINPTLHGRLFCDENGDCEPDADETSFTEDVTLSLVKVDCNNPDTVLATLPDIVFTANGTGDYEVPDLAPGGCYRLDLVSPTDLPPLCEGAFPIDFSMPSIDDDPVPDGYCCLELNIGIICETFSLCGDVFCNTDGNCTYDPVNGDGPLFEGTTVTVTLEQLTGPGGQVTPFPARTYLVDHTSTRWCFGNVDTSNGDPIDPDGGLPPGWYRVTVTSTTVAPTPGCPVECERELGIDIVTPECPFAFECPPSCVILFCDDNRNGQPDDGELRLEGVTVTATGPAVVPNQVTGVDGKACFDLTPGAWTLEAQEPAGGWSTIVPYLEGPLSGASREVTVVAGQTTPDTLIPFGCVGRIFGKVVVEEGDWDGELSPGEAFRPVPSITVTLTGTSVDGPVNTNTTTNAAGEYEFNDLAPGDYTVAVDGTQIAALNLQPSTPQTVGPTALAAGEEKEIDFLNCDPGSVCVVLFCDDNRNGQPDAGEFRLSGVEVRAALGQTTETTDSDTDGKACFENLEPGTWTLTAIEPAGGWSTIDPRVLGPLSGLTREVEVTAGQATPDAFIPFECVGRIFGKVVVEEGDWDGVLSPGEAFRPVPNITVILTGVSVDGPVNDSTTTNATGEYEFNDLAPGDYTVTVNGVQIAALSLQPSTPQSVGPTSLASGEEVEIDFLNCDPGSVCVVLFCDDNRNGQPDAGEFRLSGVEVRAALGQTTETTDSDTDGKACFENLEPGTWTLTAIEPAGGWSTIDPRVLGPLSGLTREVEVTAGQETPDAFIPFECVGRIFGKVVVEEGDWDGVLSPGEAFRPVPNITVNLAGVSVDGPVADSTTTNAAGEYEFNGLAPGDYTVSVDGVQIAALSLQPSTPQSVGPTSLASGEEVEIDFLNCDPGSVCVVLFCDDNRNGQPDAGEFRLSGVEVRAALGQTTETTDSDADGKACFENLEPGTWTLTAIEPAGGWSTIDPRVLGPLSGLSREVEVTAGQETPDAFIPFECVGRIFGKVVVEEGDWDGVLSPGEAFRPVPNITVNLAGVSVDGPVADSTTTNAAGEYEFNDLAPGDYTVSVNGVQIAALNLQPSTPQSVGPTSLASGQEVEIDFLNCDPGSACVRLFCDENDNGVFDAGDVPLNSVAVTATMGQTTLNGTSGSDGPGRVCFENLEPGTWTLTAIEPVGGWSSVDPRVSGPIAGLSRIVEVKSGEEANAVILFDCPRGSIFGKVCVEEGDWDGVISPGETCRPVQSILVTLTGVTAEGPVNREFITGPNGQYNFEDLPAGTYVVSVDGAQIAALNLQPSTPQSVPTVLLQGGTAEIDFLNCEPGKLEGYVFVDPRKDCDGVYEPTDEELAGITINLIQNAAIIDTTTTNGDGYYVFENLEPGEYDVMVVTPNPNTRNLTLITPEGQTRLVPAGGTERADFGYATQGLTGRVWKESTDCDPDDTFGAGDTALPGILVQITGVSGEANGFTDSLTTAADGSYSFQEIPEGRYEVTIDDSDPTVVDCVFDVTMRDPLVPICDDGEANFWCCEDCVLKTCACIRVFMEPRDFCDGEFTPGRDTWVSDAQVFIKIEGEDGYLEWKYTDADGRACWDGLQEDVNYRLYLGANQDKAGLPKCPEVYCNFTPDCSEDGEECCECVVGFCEPCEPQLCCEGNLREVEVQTEVWCGHVDGDQDVCVDLNATLFDGCGPNANAVDTVAMDFCNEFPGAKTGLDGVVTVDNVELTPWGTALVRLKLSGAGLAAGHFGDGDYRVTVTLNGDTSTGCTKLRCETIRRGSWFTYSRLCGPRPPCDRVIYDIGEWAPCDPDCKARFQTLETLSYESWKDCTADPDPECEPVGPKVYEVTCLVPCEYQQGLNTRHAQVKMNLGDGGPLDLVQHVFDGNDWTGAKHSTRDCITLLRVWKVGERDGKCIWKIRIAIHRPCCINDVDGTGDGKLDLLRRVGICCTVDWVGPEKDQFVTICPDIKK